MSERIDIADVIGRAMLSEDKESHNIVAVVVLQKTDGTNVVIGMPSEIAEKLRVAFNW